MRSSTLRRDALEKLAQLSAKPSSTTGHSDLAKLCQRCPQPNRPRVSSVGSQKTVSVNGSETTARIPMKLGELEVLVALCKAAPLIRSLEPAEKLLSQLAPYLQESFSQVLTDTPGFRSLEPSPWELLTYNLASAILSLGLNHPTLRAKADDVVYRYIQGWSQAAGTISTDRIDGEDAVGQTEVVRTITLTVSLLGMLDAAAQHARLWTPSQRLHLVTSIRQSLADDFMICLEAALSVVRNARSGPRILRDWKRITKHYAAIGRPLGAMILNQGFMKLVLSSAALVACYTENEMTIPPLDYLQRNTIKRHASPEHDETALMEKLSAIAVDELEFLQGDSDYLQRVGSVYQRHLASAVKADVFTTLVCCMVFSEDIIDSDTLLGWLENTVADPVQIADEDLAVGVLKCLPILAKVSPAIANNLSKSLPRVIVQGGLTPHTAELAAECLTNVLRLLPQDAIIATLYSLGNVLSASSLQENGNSAHQNGSIKQRNHSLTQHHEGPSTISLAASDAEEPSQVYSIVISTIISVARSCKDEKISALALSMLVQKIGRVNSAVDAKIITETAPLATIAGPNELKSLLKLYSKATHDSLVQNNTTVLDAVLSARNTLSREIKIQSPLFEVLITNLLDTIVSKGDAHEKDNKHFGDTELAAQEIAQLLSPLATLVAANADGDDHEMSDEINSMQRDAWFNVAVHGFHLNSPLGKKYSKELRTLAQYSTPLIAEDRADQIESDIELNTVLRRGKNGDNSDRQKKHLIELLPNQEAEIKSLSYSEVVFLNAVFLLEDLRASCGDCTSILTYFLDPKLRSGDMGECMTAIARVVVDTYLVRTRAGDIHSFSTPYLARQLAIFFAAACHRIAKVQQIATMCADAIIRDVPSTLCQKTALFALLEILSMMWFSCLEGETDEYGWKSSYASPTENIKLQLSDNFEFRHATLQTFNKHAKAWVLKALDIAPLDIKGLLQTYLSEYDDDGAYGHVSLGRSFALEMGSAIPPADQRLGAIENHPQLNFNTASDFVAQYTTRQEYRFVDGLVDQHQEEWLREDKGSFHRIHKRPTVDRSIDDATRLLMDLESRTTKNRQVPIAELRDILRRSAALLCRVKGDQCAIVQHLVGIPYAVFTKQSIKLGISLWMSVIKENPRMESRILASVADNWESTVKKRRGIFNERFNQADPFFVKIDFAPSDKDFILRRQQQASSLVSPHYRLLQFLSSHFNASRLCSPSIEKIYSRLVRVSLDAVDHGQATNHPLAREVRLHLILLALRVLKFSTHMPLKAKWRLKDKILGSALAWFARPLKWSFGGNRLQIKAETHLLADVRAALNDSPADVGYMYNATASLRSLNDKQNLLVQLLHAEETRLMVWLFPLDYHSRRHFTSNSQHKLPIEGDLTHLVKTAWAEHPSLAVHLATRFEAAAIQQQVRWQILNFPDKVVDEPEALELLLGTALPSDVSFQLKYLLYWKPVNPITAVTYFLPAYGNHACIIQYAMRALESHSVDVTFFYVPQIVQALRYDVLGYVERYIIETGSFSQLFAHQIIWNMKANAFKDEDATIPDSLKPTLDKVRDALIASFSGEDRSFYEREFAFFDEVTSISGKLRPYIGKPKELKKEKIEEELRKIQVEPGVYLPSNPDGVVVGIDRKSGKPLQSHAKAPYMATFRIRKEIAGGDADNEDRDQSMIRTSDAGSANSYEVWQSAIFKVGDDCRQDVLALQLIATFRSIFHSIGLDVWVYPYRVTATAPGCGVIDVLPKSISRDMVGREAVNGLYDYFVSKYGSEESPRFQEARNNFVKSMAAYSVISYLLQFKDRHNGNLMVDEAGHLIHIDFGFCFDIAPGGIKFERAPFKLTHEMMAVMGGNNPPSQAFKWFQELCIKAFLAVRPHSEHVVHLVICMLDSGLPCFKPETIKHLRERFVLEKTETEAAGYMGDLIRRSAGSQTTKVYDHFQLITNGIPY